MLALLAGCYAPSVATNLPCSETLDCPDGQICDLATLTCVIEIPPARRFNTIAAGHRHACGIDFDNDDDGGGTMWCWGDNIAAQLGSPGELSTAPIQVGGADDWATVSVADNESIGIRADGTMWSWGEFDFEYDLTQLGVGTTWESVSAGYLSDCALAVGGEMTCGFLGTMDLARPGTWQRVATNDERVCAIDDADRLWCWGKNDDAAVGDGTTEYAADPVEVMPGSTFIDVTTATDHTCAIRSDRVAFCWGNCQRGQLGDGRDPLRACEIGVPTPTQVIGEGYIQIRAFDLHTCALRDDGDILCWGNGELGQTGSGVERHADPRLAFGNGGWIDVYVGGDFTCARDTYGAAYCWGGNHLGQLGDGNGGDVLEPEQIAPGPLWGSVHAGYRSTCAIERNETLWCWGRNGRGELGTGDRRQPQHPTQVGDLVGWEAVSIGRDHGCGILEGVLHCWGAQGESTDADEWLAPAAIHADDDWTAVAAGTWFTCALKGGDGQLWCWGVGEAPDRIGNDTGWTSLDAANGAVVQDTYLYGVRDGAAFGIRGDFQIVAQATAVTDWRSVASGFEHQCGIRSDDTAWCWGSNGAGELGNSTVVGGTSDAVPVETGVLYRSIAAGLNFTCAVEVDSELSCWGRISGEFGGSDWFAVTAGRDHACAIREDDSVWCFGADDNDQLGRGLGGSATPVRVLP